MREAALAETPLAGAVAVRTAMEGTVPPYADDGQADDGASYASLPSSASSSSLVPPQEEDAAVLALLGLSRLPSCENIAGEAEAAAARRAAAMPASSLSGRPMQVLAAPSSAPLTGHKRMRATTPTDGDAFGVNANNGFARYSPVPKPDGDAKFFCKFPGCGKGYASTDAVRKHCRQRHLEWLRRLGHGCPALYCHWGEEKP